MSEEVKQTENVDDQMGKNNPEDIAAAFYTKHHQRLLNNLSQMSKRQLVRVAYHVATNGLTHKDFKLNDDIEKQTAYTMLEMISNRVIMQLHAEMEKALTNEQKSDIINESKENETNG